MHSAVKVEKKKERQKKCVTSPNDSLIKILLRQQQIKKGKKEREKVAKNERKIEKKKERKKETFHS